MNTLELLEQARLALLRAEVELAVIDDRDYGVPFTLQAIARRADTRACTLRAVKEAFRAIDRQIVTA